MTPSAAARVGRSTSRSAKSSAAAPSASAAASRSRRDSHALHDAPPMITPTACSITGFTRMLLPPRMPFHPSNALHPPDGPADNATVSTDEFFTQPASTLPAFTPTASPRPAPHAAGRGSWAWPLLVAAVIALALVAGVVVWVWPHSSKATGPDPATARLFGQQTRTQL